VIRVAEPTDLVNALLEADDAERERLVRTVDETTLEVAVGRLGHLREPAAAEVLTVVELVAPDRALKKAARRELHRLRSVGVSAPPREVAIAGPVAAEPPALRRLDVSEALATDIDPGGSRALWLMAERPLGGVWFAPLLLSDSRGLIDMALVDTTRKRFLSEVETQRGRETWISMPVDYALPLVREAVDLTREVGGSLPTRYRAFKDEFGEAGAAPERALIYEHISLVEINFNPSWLEDSADLTSEPEVAGWYVPLPAEMQPRALDVARSPVASLLVPGHSPEQQTEGLLDEAVRLGLTPAFRRSLRRRLEETAYIFYVTERLAVARLAAASAQGLAETPGGARLPFEQQPFVRVLLATGLARLLGGETINGRPAAESLMELVDRAATTRENRQGGGETRPSGLILPR
jgi:hypothetical protein